MMGQLSSGQDRLLYSFNLENHIPKNHLLRSIDRRKKRGQTTINNSGLTPVFLCSFRRVAKPPKTSE